MDRPKGYQDTFSRPHLVAENESARQTITQIQNVVMNAQTQTINLQRQLHSMRNDGKSTLEQQTAVIDRITRNNHQIDDMARQIGKLQVLVQKNMKYVAYYDWLRGQVV